MCSLSIPQLLVRGATSQACADLPELSLGATLVPRDPWAAVCLQRLVQDAPAKMPPVQGPSAEFSLSLRFVVPLSPCMM